ncbi:uncharacterized protein LOC122530493 [Frieseomelitta varia]|uniref:uncharacterized protein LOC122530493 n=1 Tax=Frieseomelitta varia TaxID=561572 RepID=UPI001CB6A8D3|nr:uncharacterized protein LOC122530493 [Frieseomelitta varia]
MGRMCKRRNKAPQSTYSSTENPTADQGNEKEAQERPRRRKIMLRYYFGRFRYYHYCLVEKLGTLVGVVCLSMIKIYFVLMRWNQQLNEMTNAINECRVII